MRIDGHSDIDDIIALGGIERIAEITGSILAQNGIERPLFSTQEIERIQWRERIRTQGLCFSYADGKSVSANIDELFKQAEEVQSTFGEKKILGALLQHLVGAKLEIDLSADLVRHQKFTTADHKNDRHATFQLNDVAIHVTTHPSEAIIGKAAENIAVGLKPMIVSLPNGARCAEFLLSASKLRDQIEIIDAIQFLTASIYQRSNFEAGKCSTALKGILERYNRIIADLEEDPLLIIHFRPAVCSDI